MAAVIVLFVIVLLMSMKFRAKKSTFSLPCDSTSDGKREGDAAVDKRGSSVNRNRKLQSGCG